ncbi:hypothetical protein JHK85_004893 [Glycine max]|nr:hypothetical protein JHK85_004893 [Glycine max]
MEEKMTEGEQALVTNCGCHAKLLQIVLVATSMLVGKKGDLTFISNLLKRKAVLKKRKNGKNAMSNATNEKHGCM